MTREKINKDLGNQFLVVGPYQTFGIIAKAVGGWAMRLTADPGTFESWLRPVKELHPIDNPTTRGGFHEMILTEWWERHQGDHRGGHFNREHYIKYLQAQIK